MPPPLRQPPPRRPPRDLRGAIRPFVAPTAPNAAVDDVIDLMRAPCCLAASGNMRRSSSVAGQTARPTTDMSCSCDAGQHIGIITEAFDVGPLSDSPTSTAAVPRPPSPSFAAYRSSVGASRHGSHSGTAIVPVVREPRASPRRPASQLAGAALVVDAAAAAAALCQCLCSSKSFRRGCKT